MPGRSGGTVRGPYGDTETTMAITTTQKGDGGGWRFAPGQSPILDRFVSDPCGRLTVVCRWPEGRDPAGVRVAFPSDKSVARSPTSPFAPDRNLPVVRAFEPLDGGTWRRFSVPLSELEGGGKGLTAEAVLVFTEKPTELTIRELAVSRHRNVQLELYCDPGQVWKHLVVRGRTEKAVEEADVVVQAGDGKAQSQTVAVKEGVFECTWDRPPLGEGETNTVYATVRGGKMPADRSLPIRVDGTRGDNEHLWLRVKGKHIVTSPSAKGGERVFVPVGLGYARKTVFGGDGEDDAVAKYCKEHHLNTIRLAFYTRHFNSFPNQPIDIDKHMVEQIDPVVAAAKRQGLYVILDAHEFGSGTINENLARSEQKYGLWNERAFEEWIGAWVKVAARYKDEPYALGYELLNEPHDQPGPTVREYYTRCLKAIREVDQRHIIIVGTADWSHSRALEPTWGAVARTVDAPHNNILFAFHEYPKDNDPWFVRDWVVQFRDKYNVPVLCTEFGATFWSHSETVCRDFQAGLLALCAQEDIGWMIWAMSGFADDPREPLNPGGGSARDSCPYTDIWPPMAEIMGSPLPVRK